MKPDFVERRAECGDERRAESAERSAVLRGLLAENFVAQGFYGFAFLGRDTFLEALDGASIPEETRRKYDVADVKSVAVLALRYGEGGYPAPAWTAETSGRASAALTIARFARANWYGELSARALSAVASAIAGAAGKGIDLPPAKTWRRLVNSGLPEKPLAAKAGLGWIGKNGILVAAGNEPGPGEDAARPGTRAEAPAQEVAVARGRPAFSSAVVLGLLLCPVDLGKVEQRPLRDGCGACGRCIEACPTAALGRKSPEGKKPKADSFEGVAPRFERERCIQHWTSVDGKVPEPLLAVWGGRLYGCDSCLEACPHFRPDPAALCELGRLGPVLPASYFEANDEAKIRRDLAGTALDRRWISIKALKRSARLAITEALGR